MFIEQQNNFDVVIGVEVHVQLQTPFKMFSNEQMYSNKKPNKFANLIDKSIPGTLPVVNTKAIKLAIYFGKLINGQISRIITFDRKHYFYPDLPKGYQITQHQVPIVQNGALTVIYKNTTETIKIKQAHLEEDTGKLQYNKSTHYAALDLNRAGAALLEIVTEPTITTVEYIILYLKKLHKLLKINNISTGKLEAGEFRCDINISLKKKECCSLNNKVELKNLNSFKCIEKAIKYEIKRQQKIYNSTKPFVKTETRLFDKKKNTTVSLRNKENKNEYKYTEEPNIPNIIITQKDLLSILKKKKNTRTKTLLNTVHTSTNEYILKFKNNTKIILKKIIIQNKDKIHQYPQRRKNILNYFVGCYNILVNKKKENLHSIKALLETILEKLL